MISFTVSPYLVNSGPRVYCTAILYLAFPGFFEGFSQIWTHNLYLPFYFNSREKILKVSIRSMTTVPILKKSLFMFSRVLNTFLMMVVARYWESISKKTKFLFSVLEEKTIINIYSWQCGNIYNVNDGPNEKKMSSCLNNQTEKTSVVEWNEDINI